MDELWACPAFLLSKVDNVHTVHDGIQGINCYKSQNTNINMMY